MPTIHTIVESAVSPKSLFSISPSQNLDWSSSMLLILRYLEDDGIELYNLPQVSGAPQDESNRFAEKARFMQEHSAD